MEACKPLQWTICLSRCAIQQNDALTRMASNGHIYKELRCDGCTRQMGSHVWPRLCAAERQLPIIWLSSFLGYSWLWPKLSVIGRVRLGLSLGWFLPAPRSIRGWIKSRIQRFQNSFLLFSLDVTSLEIVLLTNVTVLRIVLKWLLLQI